MKFRHGPAAVFGAAFSKVVVSLRETKHHAERDGYHERHCEPAVIVLVELLASKTPAICRGKVEKALSRESEDLPMVDSVGSPSGTGNRETWRLHDGGSSVNPPIDGRCEKVVL